MMPGTRDGMCDRDQGDVILDFIDGLRGELHVTFEEGTWATWLYDLLKPHVTKLVVCDPRKNSRQGNKNDRIDARELADRLYMNKLSSVYHGGAGVRTLKELARSYLTISKDLGRVMSRVKAIYRNGYSLCWQASLWAASSCGVAGEDHRGGSAPPGRILLPTTRCPESLAPSSQARSVGRDRNKASKLLRQIPSIGPIRAALLIALIQTPHRFRTSDRSGSTAALRSNAQQRRLPFGEGRAAKIQEANLGSRTESRLQSRSEESV